MYPFSNAASHLHHVHSQSTSLPFKNQAFSCLRYLPKSFSITNSPPPARLSPNCPTSPIVLRPNKNSTTSRRIQPLYSLSSLREVLLAGKLLDQPVVLPVLALALWKVLVIPFILPKARQREAKRGKARQSEAKRSFEDARNFLNLSFLLFVCHRKRSYQYTYHNHDYHIIHRSMYIEGLNQCIP